MPSAHEFLQGEPQADGTWRFEIGRERHGAFGGAFGGLLAASCVHTALGVVPAKVAVSADLRFVRGLPAGSARFVPTVLHDGRTLTTMTVDVFDERDRLATRATIGLAARQILAAVDHPGASTEAPEALAWADGVAWKTGSATDAPLVESFQPRAVGRGPLGIATAVPVPWDDDPSASAEAACLAADMSVGPPVAGAFPDTPTPAPNPDLSLRFTGRPVGREVVGWARLERIDHGLATTRIEVWSGPELVAVGVSCSLILGGER